MHLPQLWNIRLVTLRAEPVDHHAQLGHHVLQEAAQEPEGAVQAGAGLVLEGLGDLLRVELVASQTDGFVVVLLGLLEREECEVADVCRCDPLEWLVAEGVAEGGHEDLAGEAGGEVVHEGH